MPHKILGGQGGAHWNPLIIKKGTTVQVTGECNVSPGSYCWGYYQYGDEKIGVGQPVLLYLEVKDDNTLIAATDLSYEEFIATQNQGPYCAITISSTDAFKKKSGLIK